MKILMVAEGKLKNVKVWILKTRPKPKLSGLSQSLLLSIWIGNITLIKILVALLTTNSSATRRSAYILKIYLSTGTDIVNYTV